MKPIVTFDYDKTPTKLHDLDVGDTFTFKNAHKPPVAIYQVLDLAAKFEEAAIVNLMDGKVYYNRRYAFVIPRKVEIRVTGEEP